MFKFIFRLIKYAFVAALGAAVAAKFMLESNAGPETEEIDLVSIYEGTQLVSVASPFYGGKILTMFGGTSLDLRKAQPAPTGIHLDLAIVCGGLAILVPEGWRVTSSVKITGGGFDDATKTDSNPDAVTVTLTGYVVFGGVSVASRPRVEAVG